MQASSFPIVSDLVLIGGGHAHVEVLRAFGMAMVPGVRLTLVSPDVLTPYSGMLPGFVAGHYSHDEAHIDLVPLCRFAGAVFLRDEAIGLDTERKLVKLHGRAPIPYDVLSIDIGSAPATSHVLGAREHATPVKPIARFVALWERLLDRVRHLRQPMRIGVVGAGAGGVELVLAMQHRIAGELAAMHRDPHDVTFQLIQGGEDILPTMPAGVRTRFEKVLKARGIEVFRGCRVQRVSDGSLITSNGAQFDIDEVLWCIGAGAQAWLGDTGLALDDNGFILVDDHLQAVAHPGVFAAGDVAHQEAHPREKAGVFAVRQGPVLAQNLRRALQGKPLKKHRPQRTWLSLISTGDKYAVGSKGPFLVAGVWVWHWKDRIDRRFMRRYGADLPQMPAPQIPETAAAALKSSSIELMRCAGCGAKAGASVLSAGLGDLPRLGRGDVLVGLDAPDDAAVLQVPDGYVQVQSVDFFRAFIDDAPLFAEIALLHALNDVWAMGAEPQAVFPILTLPAMSHAKTQALFTDVMARIVTTAHEAGAEVAGGHTGEGEALAAGFSVTGLVDPQRLATKGGARPGDLLVLTRPIGSGVLFAAEMRAAARGPWIDAALAEMRIANGPAARLLLEHGSRGLTDVSGFGLAGHLTEMIQAAGLGVDLYPDAVPVYDGALDLAGDGVRSTLYVENRRFKAAIQSDIPAPSGEDIFAHPMVELLFDPQTAGGLLAAVPEAEAEGAVRALRAAGYRSTNVIGQVAHTPQTSPRITLRS